MIDVSINTFNTPASSTPRLTRLYLISMPSGSMHPFVQQARLTCQDVIKPYKPTNGIRQRSPLCHRRKTFFTASLLSWSPDESCGRPALMLLIYGRSFFSSDSPVSLYLCVTLCRTNVDIVSSICSHPKRLAGWQWCVVSVGRSMFLFSLQS